MEFIPEERETDLNGTAFFPLDTLSIGMYRSQQTTQTQHVLLAPVSHITILACLQLDYESVGLCYCAFLLQTGE